MGGGGGDTRHLFLLSLYNSKNIAENVSPGPLCSAFPGLTRLLKCILGIEYLNRGNKLILDQVKQIVYNYTYTKSHKKLTGQLWTWLVQPVKSLTAKSISNLAREGWIFWRDYPLAGHQTIGLISRRSIEGLKTSNTLLENRNYLVVVVR